MMLWIFLHFLNAVINSRVLGLDLGHVDGNYACREVLVFCKSEGRVILLVSVAFSIFTRGSNCLVLASNGLREVDFSILACNYEV